MSLAALALDLSSHPAFSAPAPQPAAEPNLFDQLRGEVVSAAVVDLNAGEVDMAEGEDLDAVEEDARAHAELLRSYVTGARSLDLDSDILEIRIETSTGVDVIRPVASRREEALHVHLDRRQGRFLDMTYLRVQMVELALGIETAHAAGQA